VLRPPWEVTMCAPGLTLRLPRSRLRPTATSCKSLRHGEPLRMPWWRWGSACRVYTLMDNCCRAGLLVRRLIRKHGDGVVSTGSFVEHIPKSTAHRIFEKSPPACVSRSHPITERETQADAFQNDPLTDFSRKQAGQEMRRASGARSNAQLGEPTRWSLARDSVLTETSSNR